MDVVFKSEVDQQAVGRQVPNSDESSTKDEPEDRR